jgi:hypothetical protein
VLPHRTSKISAQEPYKKPGPGGSGARVKPAARIDIVEGLVEELRTVLDGSARPTSPA